MTLKFNTKQTKLVALIVSLAASFDSQVFSVLMLVNAQFGADAPRKLCGHEFMITIDMVCDGKYYDGLNSGGGFGDSVTGGGVQISQPIITMPGGGGGGGGNSHSKRHLSSELTRRLLNSDPLFVEAALGEYENGDDDDGISDNDAHEAQVDDELSRAIAKAGKHSDLNFDKPYPLVATSSNNLQQQQQQAESNADNSKDAARRRQFAEFVLANALAKLQEDDRVAALRQPAAPGGADVSSTSSFVDNLTPLLRRRKRQSSSGNKQLSYKLSNSGIGAKQPKPAIKHQNNIDNQVITNFDQLTKADKQFLRFKLRSMRRFKRNSGRSEKKNCCKSQCAYEDLKLFCQKE